LRGIFLAPNTSTSLQTPLEADAYPAHEEQTLNTEKSPIYRAGTQRPKISRQGKAKFETKVNLSKKESI
jgi:hypothetical protein